MTRSDRQARLAEAISLRETGRDEEARQALLELNSEFPNDPMIKLHCARVHDKLGLEAEAVPFYEGALTGHLDRNDLRSALLGLGSSYRALGQYEKAVATLRRAVDDFPSDSALQTFLAMALYNVGESKVAAQTLLRIVAETSADPEVSKYREALGIYAEDLDRVW